MNKKEEMKYSRLLGDKKVYEMTPEEKEAPITKEMGELCRHRLEKRWYRRLVELNILIVVCVIGTLIGNFHKNMEFFQKYGQQMIEEFKEAYAESAEESEETKEQEDTDTTVCKCNPDKVTEDDLPFEITAFLYGAFLLGFGIFGLYLYYALYRSMSLRITEKNFPEVYQTIENYAHRLGIAVPKAYVMQSDGVLNAFSTFLFKRQWILIHSELFEVAYREHHDMDALNFVIAHEMAHIYYGHATFHYNFWIWFADRIPVIGAIASRTREYSCDRLAQRLTGVDGIEAMLVLVVDRHLYKMVDKEDYINEMRSLRGFFIWLVNLIMDHPIMSKRIIALEEGRGSGKLY